MSLFKGMLTNNRILGAAVIAATLFTPAIASAATAYVSASVNVRSGPGSNYGRLAALPAGATVNAGSCRNGWCQIYNGSRLLGSRLGRWLGSRLARRTELRQWLHWPQLPVQSRRLESALGPWPALERRRQLGRPWMAAGPDSSQLGSRSGDVSDPLWWFQPRLWRRWYGRWRFPFRKYAPDARWPLTASGVFVPELILIRSFSLLPMA